MDCVSSKVTFSAAFPKYLKSRSIRLLSSLSPGFTKSLPYFVVLSWRADLGLCVELRGRQVSTYRKEALSDNPRCPQGPGEKVTATEDLGRTLDWCLAGLLQRLGDGVHDAEIQWFGAFGTSGSRTRPSSCSPAAFQAAILQFTPRWSDPSPPKVIGPAAG